MGKRVGAELRLSMCAGKQRFTTFTQAARASKRASRSRHHQERSELPTPYRCPACGAFHLGSLLGGKIRRPLPRVRRVEMEDEEMA